MLTHIVRLHFLALLVLLPVCAAMGQGVPSAVTYQGKLTDLSGQPVPDGSYQVRFLFYDHPTESIGHLLWTSSQYSVTTSGSVFTVAIQSIPVSTVFGGSEVWLETVVQGQTLTPRAKLVSAPFAFRAGDLSLPFARSVSSGGTVVSVTQTGDGRVGYFGIDNAANSNHALYAATTGGGAAVYGSTTGSGDAVSGWTNGSGRAVYGYTVGTGAAGYFSIGNPASSSPALWAATSGTGPAAAFIGKVGIGTNTPAENLDVNGVVRASSGFKFPDGKIQTKAGDLSLPFDGVVSSETDAFHMLNTGTGRAGRFQISNPASGMNVLLADTNGTGAAMVGSSTGSGAAVVGSADGTGIAGSFVINTLASANTALEGRTVGSGYGIYGYSRAGSAGYFMTSATSSSPTLHAKSSANNAALKAEAGTGPAAELVGQVNVSGTVQMTGLALPSGASPGYVLTSDGSGAGSWQDRGLFMPYSRTISSASTAFSVTNNGGGGGGYFEAISPSSSNAALRAVSNSSVGAFSAQSTGNGSGVTCDVSGTGSGGYFRIMNPSNGSPGLYTSTDGSGHAVVGLNTGTGSAGYFEIANSSNYRTALYGATNGSGEGVMGIATGTGKAGYFGTFNPANTESALYAATNGTGTALRVNHTGASGDIAVFQSGGGNQARIDKTGKGFFNGGTQTGGADVAEAFEVEGERAAYSPGDVLVISQSSDSRVEKCSAPYSTAVIGVYAARPGVLLTQRDIDDDLSDTVSVGVIGVIPTRVSGENGPIRRGDLLVTSSVPGHAMRGTDRGRMLGAIIGKALQNFEGPGTGVINVLVNVK